MAEELVFRAVFIARLYGHSAGVIFFYHFLICFCLVLPPHLFVHFLLRCSIDLFPVSGLSFGQTLMLVLGLFSIRRLDVNFAVDWASKPNYLSVPYSMPASLFSGLSFCQTLQSEDVSLVEFMHVVFIACQVELS